MVFVLGEGMLKQAMKKIGFGLFLHGRLRTFGHSHYIVVKNTPKSACLCYQSRTEKHSPYCIYSYTQSFW